MAVLAWHYTKGIHLQSILNDRVIKLATTFVPAGERPVVWFSLNQEWESTAAPWYGDLRTAAYPNPIATLYKLISDGLHQRTEDECVEIFDRCKVAFEYVVKKLTEAKRDDDAYIESIHNLNRS